MTIPAYKDPSSGQPAGGPDGFLRRNVQLLVGLLVSVSLGWVLIRTIDLAKTWHYLAGANIGLLLLCSASVLLSMLLKTFRWRYLFPDRACPSFQPMLSSLYIGYLMNTVLPARIGEFVRAFLVGLESPPATSQPVGAPVALGTIVLEKVLDLATLVAVLVVLLALNQVPELPDWMELSPATSAAGVAAGLLAVGAMLTGRRYLLRFASWLEERIAPLRRLHAAKLLASFLEGLASLARRDTLPPVVIGSVAVWASSAFTLWVGVTAVGVSVGLSAVLLMLVVTNIGMAVPSMPGYVGVFHALMVGSLTPFGVPVEQALAASFVVHAVIFSHFLLGGAIFLLRGGHSLGGLRRAAGH